ncbi:hypothetical protein RDABS01_016429 [Bienertia sinuspersici]
MWRIGNGLEVNVWNDCWIMNNGIPMHLVADNSEEADLRVADLIDFNHGCWNKELVLQPSMKSWPSDLLFWWPCSNGIYSVKFAYWLGKLGHLRDSLDCAHELQRACWKLVWKMAIPPKLKHFLWRACKGILATMESLYNRYISPTKASKVCGDPCESIMHSLFYCKYATAIWSKSKFQNILQDAPCNSFMEFLVWFCEVEGNKLILESSEPRVDEIARGFVKFVEDYSMYNKKVTIIPKNIQAFPSLNTWTCHPEGNVKVNVNAHINGRGYVGYGAVIRDDAGRIVSAAVRRVEVRWRAAIAEAQAALFGVIANFTHFACTHVKRNGNHVAHFVARGDVEVGLKRVWLDPIPQTLCNIAAFDLI